MRGGALAALICASASLAVAEAPSLALPLDCRLGETCFIEDYVDATPGQGQSDYACGLKSRDGHGGTDFALLDHAAMAQGVDVLAAAPGLVDATRDGLVDEPYGPANAAALRGKECGNAVRIRHSDGYQTLYCHLKRGSLTVEKGDRVDRGTPLGEVGMSGQSNYPHVHITVLHNGKRVDPFATKGQACGHSGPGLWQTEIPYDRTGLFTAGFSTSVPKFEDVKSGAARAKQASPDQPLVLYTHVFWGETGDMIELRAHGPQGQIFAREIPVEKGRAQLTPAFGRRAPDSGWPGGAYRGYVTLKRDGRVLAVRHADIVVQ